MGEANVHRSQAILRMPVDYVDATLILHDGDRSEVIFLLPPGEDLARVITEGDAFISVMRNAKMCIVARDAVAALGIAPKIQDDDALPTKQQKALVRLRSGLVLEGELQWTIESEKSSTTDYLNRNAHTIELRVSDKSYVIVKSHVAYVQEQ